MSGDKVNKSGQSAFNLPQGSANVLQINNNPFYSTGISRKNMPEEEEEEDQNYYLQDSETESLNSAGRGNEYSEGEGENEGDGDIFANLTLRNDSGVNKSSALSKQKSLFGQIDNSVHKPIKIIPSGTNLEKQRPDNTVNNPVQSNATGQSKQNKKKRNLALYEDFEAQAPPITPRSVTTNSRPRNSGITNNTQNTMITDDYDDDRGENSRSSESSVNNRYQRDTSSVERRNSTNNADFNASEQRNIALNNPQPATFNWNENRSEARNQVLRFMGLEGQIINVDDYRLASISENDAPLCVQDCGRYFEAAHQMWSPPKDDNAILSWANEKFGCTLNSSIDFKTLSNRYTQEVNKLWILYLHFVRNGLVCANAHEETNENIEIKRNFSRLFEAISAAYWSVEAPRRLKNAINPEVEHYLPPEASFFRYMAFDPNTFNEIQRVLLHVLYKLFDSKYRRYKKECWEEIICNGFRTRSWRRVCSIEEFVMQCTRKEENPIQWGNLTKKLAHRKNIIDYLGTSLDTEFPTLIPDRHTFSFKNGIYMAHKNKFVPYGEGSISEKITSCNFFEYDFPYEKLNTSDWFNEIPTPVFQEIISYQKFGSDADRQAIEKWIYVFVGKMMYKLKEKDRWQVAPLIKGRAGTGKSTIGQHIASIYQGDDVGTIGGRGEKTFALMGIVDKLVWFCFELKKDFPIHQGDLQSMITGGEKINVPFKNKPPLLLSWIAPCWIFGNEDADWFDSQGSISRRFVSWLFEKTVVNVKPNFDELLKAEMPAFILKSNLAYLSAVEEFGDKSFWEIPGLPKYFFETQRKMQAQINPLFGFIDDETVFERDATRYTKLSVFKSEYHKFCRENSIKNTKFDPDHYLPVFEKFKLTIEKKEEIWQGKVDFGIYVYGLGFVGDNAGDKAQQSDISDLAQKSAQLANNVDPNSNANFGLLQRPPRSIAPNSPINRIPIPPPPPPPVNNQTVHTLADRLQLLSTSQQQ